MESRTELIVVRHGETPWNMDRRMQGHEDVPLNETGRRQARAVAAHLAAESIDRIYSSDLQRALETAETIRGRRGIALFTDVRLREIHMGSFQGMTQGEAREKHTEAWERFFIHDAEFALPGGQSRSQKQIEIAEFMEEVVRDNPGRRLVIVTHGGILIAMLRHVLHISPSHHFRVSIDNGGIQRFLYSKETWYLVSWGEVDHLATAKEDR
ncbi:MAG TPA: histidine phosphatase family protein [bacterium]|nr:histidine phosphatase family protein [bacterium]HQG45268.1 histidine phosphatase family protein [bacterium]HQI48334.1 histidine phosphatase family protein [bacterium]HQJ63436.1 histidine phosphatase family protein [bacterium]